MLLAFLATWAHADSCSAAVNHHPQVLFCQIVVAMNEDFGAEMPYIRASGFTESGLQHSWNCLGMSQPESRADANPGQVVVLRQGKVGAAGNGAVLASSSLAVVGRIWRLWAQETARSFQCHLI